MPSVILAEHGTPVSLMSTGLQSLAHSVVGVGRQSAMVGNEDNAQIIQVLYTITVNSGSAPADNGVIRFYLLKGDNEGGGNEIRTFDAGPTDNALTVPDYPHNPALIHQFRVTTATDVAYSGSFVIRGPGPEWGLCVVNSTGQALKASGQSVRYYVENQEIQDAV